MNKILAITLTFVSLMLLTACGIKGPLYIEEPTAKQTVSTIPTSTSSSSSDADDAQNQKANSQDDESKSDDGQQQNKRIHVDNSVYN